VNWAIEAGEKRVYRRRMRPALLRLLALLAVMMMPFGMAAAPAASAHHHPMAAAMPMKHCPEVPARHAAQMGIGACTMACAAALPAVDLSRALPLIVSAPDFPGIAKRLEGHQPEIATPPPRRS
jgi:hypothetical protein